ncbi:MAG: hypothetical protein AVDCRST_MAG22-2848, partial [uncultured Rubrobacteraceae bacterium]
EGTDRGGHPLSRKPARPRRGGTRSPRFHPGPRPRAGPGRRPPRHARRGGRTDRRAGKAPSRVGLARGGTLDVPRAPSRPRSRRGPPPHPDGRRRGGEGATRTRDERRHQVAQRPARRAGRTQDLRHPRRGQHPGDGTSRSNPRGPRHPRRRPQRQPRPRRPRRHRPGGGHPPLRARPRRGTLSPSPAPTPEPRRGTGPHTRLRRHPRRLARSQRDPWKTGAGHALWRDPGGPCRGPGPGGSAAPADGRRSGGAPRGRGRAAAPGFWRTHRV